MKISQRHAILPLSVYEAILHGGIMSSHNPIRILHVLAGMNRAGTETMLMNLYRAINREKIQFDFAVTTNQRCAYDGEIEAMGGKIIRYPRYRGVNHFSYVRWWQNFFSEHPEYRIVHGHIGSTAAIYLSIAKRNGRFTIAHSHNTAMSPLYRLYSYPTRYIADYFMACSKAAMVSRYGSKVANNPAISAVLPNGIDVEKYRYDKSAGDSMRAEVGIKPEELLIGTVGRLSAQKNPFFIVHILEELRAKEADFRFLWVGTGNLKEEIEQRVAQKGLENNVLFLGVRDDIPRIFQALNVFILPSKYEGLGVAAVEAQAAGLPVLLSDKVPIEAKITAGCQSLPIDSPKAWAEAVLKEQRFRRIENAAEDVIKAGYDVHATGEWLYGFYQSRWH